MNGRLNNRDRLFIRLDARGIAIADSAIWRKQIPRGNGRWKDITEAVLGCCSTAEPTQGSFLVISATSLDSDSQLTGITFPGYDWTGELESGGMMVVPLPYGFAETITLTVLVPDAAMAITTDTIQGDGVIAGDVVVSTDADPQTVELTVTSTPGSQYLVTLTDD